MTTTVPIPASTLRLVVIIGSTRQSRFAPTIAKWFARQVERHEGLSLDALDLAAVALPGVLGDANHPGVAALAQRLNDADPFVVITPEYNHSFPGPLKSAIDWFSKEWQAKPVAFVSYGGASGGLRAVEQLRQVFAELHAVTIRDGVSFPGAWVLFDGDGELKEAPRYERAASRMLAQLSWWGQALRTARVDRPYAF